LHVVAQRREAGAQLVVGLLHGAVIGGDLGRALQHFGVQLFELSDLRLQLAESLRAFFVAADLGIDVAHQLVELGHLSRGAVDHVTLLLERRDFLGSRRRRAP